MAEPADGLDDFRAFATVKGPACSVCRVMATMPDEHRELVSRAIVTADITDIAVAKWLAANHYDLKILDPRASVRNHRQGKHG